MPAIPVYARVEMHLTDDELRALARLARELVEDHCIYASYARAGQTNSAGVQQLNAAMSLHSATVRALRERNLTA